MKICCFFVPKWSNNMSFIPAVHKFDNWGSGVKCVIFNEEWAEVDCFKTMFSDHIVNVSTTEANKCAYEVISKYSCEILP
jgi:hypothetical protein